MKNIKKYYFFSDDSHGWLRVKIHELINLSLLHCISNYSYYNKNYAYLEEDVDAPLFLKRIQENKKIEIKERYTKHSKIRNYPSFNNLIKH